MTNGENYKNAKDCALAFASYCANCPAISECLNQKRGGGWKNVYANSVLCFSRWLDYEADEEKPLPCPFCGGECECEDVTNHTPIDKEMYSVYCLAHSCMYQSKMYKTESEAIAAHNRVARAVMAAVTVAVAVAAINIKQNAPKTKVSRRKSEEEK